MYAEPETKEKWDRVDGESKVSSTGLALVRQTGRNEDKRDNVNTTHCKKNLLPVVDIKQLTKIINKLKLEGAAGSNGIPNTLFKLNIIYWAHISHNSLMSYIT